jgi:prepilin peptidase CpaA
MGLFVLRTLLWAMTLSVLVAAAGFDLRRRIIPNALVIAVATTGIALGLVLRPGAMPLSLLIAAAVLLGFLVCTHYRLIGAGDAKMLAAVSLMVPPQATPTLLLEIALVGGLLSAVYLAARWRLRRVPVLVAVSARTGGQRSLTYVERLRRNEHIRILSGASVPYALAILGGVLVHILSEWHQCLSATSCFL